MPASRQPNSGNTRKLTLLSSPFLDSFAFLVPTVASSQFFIVTILSDGWVFPNLIAWKNWHFTCSTIRFHTFLVCELSHFTCSTIRFITSECVREWVVMKTWINKPLNPLGCERVHHRTHEFTAHWGGCWRNDPAALPMLLWTSLRSTEHNPRQL